MAKKGYLTAAEYKAIRELLGFTQQEAMKFHRVQNVRTIKRWESGDSWASELACDKITELFARINQLIDDALKQYDNAVAASGKACEVVLIVYPDGCYNKFIIGIDELPNSVHKAMVTRLYVALKARGAKVGIVEFNAQDYFIFLAKHGFQDNQSSRSQWASDYYDRLKN